MAIKLRIDKPTLTTGQVAYVCDVSPRTVSKWMEEGRIIGHRIPGSTDRRFRREDVIAFLKENNMPFDILTPEYRVLVIGDSLVTNRICECCPTHDGLRYEIAKSVFRAGLQVMSMQPDTIIVDLMIGRSEAIQICSDLHKETAFQKTLFIAFTGEDDTDTQELTAAGFDWVFKKPIDASLVCNAFRRHKDNAVCRSKPITYSKGSSRRGHKLNKTPETNGAH